MFCSLVNAANIFAARAEMGILGRTGVGTSTFFGIGIDIFSWLDGEVTDAAIDAGFGIGGIFTGGGSSGAGGILTCTFSASGISRCLADSFSSTTVGTGSSILFFSSITCTDCDCCISLSSIVK